MTDTFEGKASRPWPNPYLTIASVVGHITKESVRLWFRTNGTGKYALILRKGVDWETFKKTLKDAKPGELAADHVIEFDIDSLEHDTTKVIDIAGLLPNAEYRYALLQKVNNVFKVVLGREHQHKFRTLPARDDEFSFVFHSCHMPYKKNIFGRTEVSNIDMWDFLGETADRHARDTLRFVIAGGDQVYVDGVDTLSIWEFLKKKARKQGRTLLPELSDMVSWYRDIYRGYWGFQSVQECLSAFPHYMIWDDHEIMDGWGSFKFTGAGKKDDEMREIFPDYEERGLTYADCQELLKRMESAAKQVYFEYQHCHNPDTAPGRYDYHFKHDQSAFYVLDERGYRDMNRNKHRILGTEQLERFAGWVEELDLAKTKFLFVVSGVPVLHMTSCLVNADDNQVSKLMDLQDDLRDSWEHELHTAERREVLEILFRAARKGLRVCVLSGDVHVAAAFRIKDKATNAVIYQLTSSAITYNKPRLTGWMLGMTVPDDGKSSDGYKFERLSLFTDSNFSLIRVNQLKGTVTFQLYGKQMVVNPTDLLEVRPMTHSLAKLELAFPAPKK